MCSDRSQPGAYGAGDEHRDVNVLALVKGEERYVFLYSDEQREALKRTFGRYAANPELSFSWYDASVLCQKLQDLEH